MHCEKIWLTERSAVTSACVAYHGPSQWREDEDPVFFLEISDCHDKIRIHKASTETIVDFVAKLKALSKVIDNFVAYLELVEEPQGGVDIQGAGSHPSV